MSLINDALKRAREAQQDTHPAAAASLQFRPIEPARSASKGIGFLLPAVLVIALAAAGFWYWHLNQTTAAAPTPTVTAKSAAVPEPDPAPSPSLLSITPPKPLPAPVETNAAPGQEEIPVTKTVVPASPPPRPAPPKLQAILFDATHPSAIINGKTLFLHGTIGEYQVASISATQVTLVSETGTNVLKIAE